MKRSRMSQKGSRRSFAAGKKVHPRNRWASLFRGGVRL